MPFKKDSVQNPVFSKGVNPFEVISCVLKKFIFLKRVSVNPAVEKDAPRCLRYETGPTGRPVGTIHFISTTDGLQKDESMGSASLFQSLGVVYFLKQLLDKPRINR